MIIFEGSCNTVLQRYATGILETCPGYKLKFKAFNSWPWETFGKCCSAVNEDSECSNKFFYYPWGTCVCEKNGAPCPRSFFGFYTEFHFNSGKKMPD